MIKQYKKWKTFSSNPSITKFDKLKTLSLCSVHPLEALLYLVNLLSFLNELLFAKFETPWMSP